MGLVVSQEIKPTWGIGPEVSGRDAGSYFLCCVVVVEGEILGLVGGNFRRYKFSLDRSQLGWMYCYAVELSVHGMTCGRSVVLHVNDCSVKHFDAMGLTKLGRYW